MVVVLIVGGGSGGWFWWCDCLLIFIDFVLFRVFLPGNRKTGAFRDTQVSCFFLFVFVCFSSLFFFA